MAQTTVSSQVSKFSINNKNRCTVHYSCSNHSEQALFDSHQEICNRKAILACSTGNSPSQSTISASSMTMLGWCSSLAEPLLLQQTHQHHHRVSSAPIKRKRKILMKNENKSSRLHVRNARAYISMYTHVIYV